MIKRIISTLNCIDITLRDRKLWRQFGAGWIAHNVKARKKLLWILINVHVLNLTKEKSAKITNNYWVLMKFWQTFKYFDSFERFLSLNVVQCRHTSTCLHRSLIPVIQYWRNLMLIWQTGIDLAITDYIIPFCWFFHLDTMTATWR
jgi:hypothetical protein